jgi:putative endonuclease
MNVFKSIAAKMPVRPPTTKAVGDSGEERALEYLSARGLMLVARNFKTPGRGGGEVDLIMRAPDGTLVFVRPASAPPSAGASSMRRSITSAA